MNLKIIVKCQWIVKFMLIIKIIICFAAVLKKIFVTLQ